MMKTAAEIEGWDPPGEEWPLLFKHAYDVRGAAFKAMVLIDGALLATITDGHCWLDGVYPYEVSEGDDTISKAYENLKVFMAGILADIAAESTDFGDFEKKVQFFATHPGDECALEAWKKAVQKVRAGAANVPGYQVSRFRRLEAVSHCRGGPHRPRRGEIRARSGP